MKQTIITLSILIISLKFSQQFNLNRQIDSEESKNYESIVNKPNTENSIHLSTIKSSDDTVSKISTATGISSSEKTLPGTTVLPSKEPEPNDSKTTETISKKDIPHAKVLPSKTPVLNDSKPTEVTSEKASKYSTISLLAESISNNSSLTEIMSGKLLFGPIRNFAKQLVSKIKGRNGLNATTTEPDGSTIPPSEVPVSIKSTPTEETSEKASSASATAENLSSSTSNPAEQLESKASATTEKNSTKSLPLSMIPSSESSISAKSLSDETSSIGRLISNNSTTIAVSSEKTLPETTTLPSKAPASTDSKPTEPTSEKGLLDWEMLTSKESESEDLEPSEAFSEKALSDSETLHLIESKSENSKLTEAISGKSLRYSKILLQRLASKGAKSKATFEINLPLLIDSAIEAMASEKSSRIVMAKTLLNKTSTVKPVQKVLRCWDTPE